MNFPLTKEEFDEIYEKVPRLCVDVVIVEEDGVVLSLRLIEPYLGKWHTPGGTVYFGETTEEAVKRVAREEAGIEVLVEKLLGIMYFPDEQRDGKRMWSISLAYQCKRLAGEYRGSSQGKEIQIFKKCPDNIVPSQGRFLVEKGLLE